MNFEAEFEQYIGTAIWTSTIMHEDGSDEPMDREYGPEDISPEALASMREDLQSFLQGPSVHEDYDQADQDAHDRALAFWVSELGDGQIGHDFWLTRNHHGAGFWDRFSGQQIGNGYGQYLTEQAHPYGSSDLYIGDDGQVHVS